MAPPAVLTAIVQFDKSLLVKVEVTWSTPSTACDEAHQPAAAGLPWSGLLQGEDVEPE